MWWLVLQDLSLDDVAYGFREVAKSKQYGDPEPADVREHAIAESQRRYEAMLRENLARKKANEEKLQIEFEKSWEEKRKDMDFTEDVEPFDLQKILREKCPGIFEKGLKPINAKALKARQEQDKK